MAVQEPAFSKTAEMGDVDVKLEVVVIPVSDVDRAKSFYTGLGWRLDADVPGQDGFRVVQVTPPGSPCSVIFGSKITMAEPGSAQGLHLIVSDIEIAHAALASRGAEMSGVFHDAGGIFHHRGMEARLPGPHPSRASYGSPQHWKFNESIEFWQGVERYILEQGLWETGLNKRLTVLQGPLYDAPQPLYADDIEVPNAFWKVVVWKGEGGLKAVALIVDQTDLLSIAHVPGGQPDETARVHVTQFRATIQEVVRRSGLDLASIAPYDTAAGELPTVGEAREVLKSFSQIELT